MNGYACLYTVVHRRVCFSEECTGEQSLYTYISIDKNNRFVEMKFLLIYEKDRERRKYNGYGGHIEA